MKSYLGLIPISEKKHKKQSKMTRICIILAVFLVTALFSMADMEMRSQLRQTIRENGYWHLSIGKISEEEAAKLQQMPCVDYACPYGVENYRLDKDYTINGTPTVICGFDDSFRKVYADVGIEGKIPTEKNEVVISEMMSKELQKTMGDDISLQLNNGKVIEFTVTGIMQDTGNLLTKDCYGMVLSINTLKELTDVEQETILYYVKIKDSYNIRKSIDLIKEEFSDSDAKIGENIKILGITGQSKDSYMMQLYATAAVLAVLVITAGTLMITSNINSSLVKRTEFFGMLRCQGATKRQVKSFVTLEALNWCKSAIPIGVILGTVVSWVLCAFLRLLSPAYFADMPVIAVSVFGIVMGCIMGIVTVLLAAVSPAKKASKVSPLTAVSGNAYSSYQKSSKIHLWLLPIEVKLGIHHSYARKKNFVLMVSSFALSIILFLAFSVGIDFLHHALRPLQVYTPDLSVYMENSECVIEKSAIEEIKKLPGIKNVYGRSFAYDMSAKVNQDSDCTINLLSYEATQFNWSKTKVKEGNLDQIENGTQVITVFDMNNPLHVGDVLTLTTPDGTKDVTVGAVLTDSPFSREEGEETIICSEATFEEITGKKDYTIIDVQLTKKATQETVDTIRNMFSSDVIFSDQRADNDSVRGAYLSMSVFIYGFIAIIALISVFQIINSVAMSVNSRIHEYGTMKAIGAANEQITRMIVSESVTYGAFGILTGALLGIPLHKKLYSWIITSRWGDEWSMPLLFVTLIILIIGISCIAAVYRPVKEMQKMSIVDTLTTL